jgi:hypothetical protein
MACVGPPSTCLTIKRGLEQAAMSKGRSEATFVREALERAGADAKTPRPWLPLFWSNDP